MYEAKPMRPTMRNCQLPRQYSMPCLQDKQCSTSGGQVQSKLKVLIDMYMYMYMQISTISPFLLLTKKSQLMSLATTFFLKFMIWQSTKEIIAFTFCNVNCDIIPVRVKLNFSCFSACLLPFFLATTHNTDPSS